jgi:hypothetical protein
MHAAEGRIHFNLLILSVGVLVHMNSASCYSGRQSQTHGQSSRTAHSTPRHGNHPPPHLYARISGKVPRMRSAATSFYHPSEQKALAGNTGEEKLLERGGGFLYCFGPPLG